VNYLFWEIFLFIVGSCVGSFLNVVIYRLPRNISLLSPPSHCPYCKTKIPWYFNIPILSYIILGGKCKFCKNKISLRYPFVEFISALLFLLLFRKYSFTPPFFIFLILMLDLLIIAFIDWEHFYIPDIFSLSLIPIGLLISFYNPLFSPVSFFGFIHPLYGHPLFQSFAGALVGFLSLLFIGILGKIIFKKEAMGGGDLKLLAGIGSFIGVRGVFYVIFISSLIGSVVGLLLILFKIKKRGEYIPYGPFLSLGTFVYLYFGRFVKKIFPF